MSLLMPAARARSIAAGTEGVLDRLLKRSSMSQDAGGFGWRDMQVQDDGPAMTDTVLPAPLRVFVL